MFDYTNAAVGRNSIKVYTMYPNILLYKFYQMNVGK